MTEDDLIGAYTEPRFVRAGLRYEITRGAVLRYEVCLDCWALIPSDRAQVLCQFCYRTRVARAGR